MCVFWCIFVKICDMNRKDINVSGYDLYLKNPFLKEMGILYKVKKESAAITDANGARSVVVKYDWSLRDTYKFVRMYGNVSKYLWPKMMKWDLKTTRLFIWIMANIRKNEDYIHIDPFIALSEINLNRRWEVEKAVYRLLDDGVLAVYAEAVNHFWVNPSLFFNGDRSSLVQTEDKKLDLSIFTENEKKKVQPVHGFIEHDGGQDSGVSSDNIDF